MLNALRIKKVRKFLGMVQYYHDLWPKCSEMLAPLMELTKGGPKKYFPIKWTTACTKSFQQINSLISKETIFAYPGFSKTFMIHIDALNVQLGAVIMQEVKLLAFYSQKLSKAQINDTMTEKEPQIIVETLKEFRNIILRHEIEVFTSHKKLTYEMIEGVYQRIQNWKILIQEFGVTLLYIKVETNAVSDAFSQIPMVHHAHKLADTTLEEDTCELLCLDSLFISDNTDCFYLYIKNISFMLDTHIM